MTGTNLATKSCMQRAAMWHLSWIGGQDRAFPCFGVWLNHDICLFPFLHQLKLCTSGWLDLEALINQQEAPYAVLSIFPARPMWPAQVVLAGGGTELIHDPRCILLVTIGDWGANLQKMFYVEHKQSSDLMEIN